MTKYSGSLALLLVASLAAPGIAHAHAFSKTAEPAIDSTVSPAPHDVKIWFSGKLEPAFSKLEVHDALRDSFDSIERQLEDFARRRRGE